MHPNDLARLRSLLQEKIEGLVVKWGSSSNNLSACRELELSFKSLTFLEYLVAKELRKYEEKERQQRYKDIKAIHKI